MDCTIVIRCCGRWTVASDDDHDEREIIIMTKKEVKKGEIIISIIREVKIASECRALQSFRLDTVDVKGSDYDMRDRGRTRSTIGRLEMG